MTLSDGLTPTHGGCAYMLYFSPFAFADHNSCKPAELCPAGYQVYRKWTGGGHHHSWEGNRQESVHWSWSVPNEDTVVGTVHISGSWEGTS